MKLFQGAWPAHDNMVRHMAVSMNWGVLFVGVPMIRALFGVCIWALDFLKPPYSEAHCAEPLRPEIEPSL